MKQSTKNLFNQKRSRNKKTVVRIYTLVGAIVFSIILFTLVSRPDGDTHNFTAPPPETTSEKGTENVTSTFKLDIPAPLLDVNQNANRLKIQQIKGVDDGPRECSQNKEGTTDCYTTKYHYTISTGSPTITPGVDKTINISIPAYVSGRGSHKGRGQDKSQSDIRYFQSKLIANATISVSLDSKWCPRIEVKPDFLWKDSTKVEVFHRAKVDLQYRVEKKLYDPILNMGRLAVENFVSCNTIRQSLQEAWEPARFSIKQPGSETQQYIRIEPYKLGYVGLKLISEKLFLEFNVTADTTISSSATELKQRPFPQAYPAGDENNIAYISVPVKLNYREILDKVYKQIGSEPFFTRNRFGEHTITIKKIKLYPSNGELVIGLQLHMKNSEDWLDRSGWVYIIVTPQLLPTSDGIMLSSARFSEGTDDKEWVAIRRALKESILETIEQRGLVVYFNESTNNLLSSMKQEIEKPRPNIPILFNNSEFEINTISLLENDLVVNGALAANASFVSSGAEYETIAQITPDSDAPGTFIDPAIERIQLQMDSLLQKIDGIEKKLGQFRKILNN